MNYFKALEEWFLRVWLCWQIRNQFELPELRKLAMGGYHIHKDPGRRVTVKVKPADPARDPAERIPIEQAIDRYSRIYANPEEEEQAHRETGG